MSREGVMIAARDRARRLQAALGEGTTVLMGCPLVVLHDPPRRAMASGPAPAVNDAADGAAGGPGPAARAPAERVR
jgi:hypothetical protein